MDNDLVFATTAPSSMRRTSGGARSGRWQPPLVCRLWRGHPANCGTDSFSLLSSSGVAIEDIAHLVGHASTNVTEKVYRKELRTGVDTRVQRP
jgi:hypothetical protein